MQYNPSERKLKVLNRAFSELDQLLKYAHLTPVNRSGRDMYYLASLLHSDASYHGATHEARNIDFHR